MKAMNHLTDFQSLIVIVSILSCSDASAGDRSWSFQKCFRGCKDANCSTTDLVKDFVSKQPIILQHLGWDCISECQHVCMWQTVDDFDKDGIPQQQFFGKWPFIRIFGIQEPASALFSVLNGLSHVIMIQYFRRRVTSEAAPMYYIWHLYGLMNVNAWCWSTVFHIRDTNFTEMMDYFCAFLFVLVSLYGVCVRLALPRYHWWTGVVVGVAMVAYYIYHVHFLAFVHFDYGYNMRANITVGLLNSIAWLAWCWHVRKRQPYVWRGALTVILFSSLALLEVIDFPPFFWTIDAHSLWHLGTIPLPLLWYRFLADDCLYLVKARLPAELPSEIKTSGEAERKKHI